MANYHSDRQLNRLERTNNKTTLEITTVISCALLNKGGQVEHQEKKEALLADLKV